MSHSPSVPSKSWSVAAARWYCVDPSQVGVHQLLDAVQKKSVGLLRQALLDHPKAYRHQFHRLSSSNETLGRGQLAHVVENLRWTPALEVLWEAGDRFDRKESPDGKEGFTALEYAVFNANTAAINKMLKLGASPEHAPGKAAGAMLLLKPWSREKDVKAAAALVAGGADPFAIVKDAEGCPGTHCLLLAFLSGNKQGPAAAFLSAVNVMPSHVAPHQLTDAWCEGFINCLRSGGTEGPHTYLEMFDKLQCLGCPLPDIGVVAALGLYLPEFATASHALHAEVMQKLLGCNDLDPRQLEEAVRATSNIHYEGSQAWKANLLAQDMQSRTRQAIHPSRPSARL